MKVYTCFPGGKAKALTMSYDDGKMEDIRLLEIFNQYGIKGTFNLNYGLMCEDQTGMQHPRIPKEQILNVFRTTHFRLIHWNGIQPAITMIRI